MLCIVDTFSRFLSVVLCCELFSAVGRSYKKEDRQAYNLKAVYCYGNFSYVQKNNRFLAVILFGFFGLSFVFGRCDLINVTLKWLLLIRALYCVVPFPSSMYLSACYLRRHVHQPTNILY